MRILTRRLCEKLKVTSWMMLLFPLVSLPAAAQKAGPDVTAEKTAPTNSTVVLKSDPFQAAAANSLEELIRSNIPGVHVTAADGAPGAAVNNMIRGINFMKGSNQPLYILDGVILNPTNLDALRAYWNDDSDYQMLQNSLMNINPADIESITVLKDIASTAIYGSMGANGVVLIKTRQGRKGDVRIIWNSNVGISTATHLKEMLEAGDYTEYMTAKFGQADWQGTPVDWQDNVLRTAISHNHYLSVAGMAKDQTAYNISAGFRQREGVVNRTGLLAANLRINVDRPIGKYGRVGARTYMVYSKTDMTTGVNVPGNTSAITQMALAAPCDFGEDYSGALRMENPAAIIRDYDDAGIEYRFIPYIYAEAYPTKWLTVRTSIGVDYRDKKRQRWTGLGVIKGYDNNGMVGRADLAGIRYNFDNELAVNLEKNWGKLDAMFGFSINGDNFYNKVAEGYQLPAASHVLRAKGIGAAEKFFTANYMPEQFAMHSFYGQVGYGYKERYLLNASVRADKNSKFDDDYAVYPAVSAAWVLSEEAFLQGSRVVSNLKLRAGWGRSGIRQVSPYRYFDQFVSSDLVTPDLGIDPVEKPSVGYFVNWHGMVEETNVGLDASFWNGRLDASVNLYYRESDEYLDIMFKGAKADKGDREWRSVSSIRNEGLELSLSGDVIRMKNFRWNLAGNMAFNRGEVFYADQNRMPLYGTLNGIPVTAFRDGKAPGTFYGLRTQGIMQTYHEALAPSFYGQRLYAGDVKFLDMDGSGDVNDADRTVIGNPNPDFTFGFRTSFEYVDFVLSMNFYGTYGNDIYNLNLLAENNVSGTARTNVRKDAYAKAWQPGQTDTWYPAIGGRGTEVFSDRLVEDGSFLRCSDITLGYKVPVQKIRWIKALNVSFSVRNAFIVTGYSGYDPEVNSYASDISRYGCDYGSYPGARTFILGVSATF